MVESTYEECLEDRVIPSTANTYCPAEEATAVLSRYCQKSPVCFVTTKWELFYVTI